MNRKKTEPGNVVSGLIHASSSKNESGLFSPSLILLHGLLSSPNEFGLIAHMLRSKGLNYQGVKVPGYTMDLAPLIEDWHQWRDAAATVVSDCANDGEALVLGGLCMGGVLAAAVALKRERPIAGLVLISPTFTYDGWGLSPVRHLRHIGYQTGLDRFFSVTEREPYGVKSPKIRKWVRRQMNDRASSVVGPKKMPLRALREAEKMMKEVRNHLADLNCPLLVIHAKDDEITSLDSVKSMFDALPLRDKEIAVLENSYHMVTIDNDRHEVVALLDRFVKRLQ